MSPGSPIPLLDITGASTGAWLNMYQPAYLGLGTTDDPGTTSDDEFLLDDYVESLLPLQYCTFNGLAAGIYTVYTYAFTPSSPASVMTVLVLGGGGDTSVQGAWTGGYVEGVTHARHTVAVGSQATLSVRVETLSGSTLLNGIQLVRQPVNSSSFCDGSVIGTACLACGNNGLPGFGCGNAGFPNVGAQLQWSGAPSASAAGDTLQLRAMNLTGPVMFIQSDGLASSPIPFGDGILCAAVGIRRLELCNQISGTAVTPNQPTSPKLHVQGLVSAGQTKHYQGWYRDANTFCTADTFNLTNGWSITWLP
jgi:hypothetical protein